MRAALADLLQWLFDDDPLAETDHRARLLLLDTLGCAIAGQSKPEPSALARRFADLESGTVALPGLDTPLTVSAATFMLAVGACWDEACEGLARGHGNGRARRAARDAVTHRFRVTRR